MHQTSCRRRWLAVVVIVWMTVASLPLTVATTITTTDGILTSPSYHHAEKAEHVLFETDNGGSLMRKDRGIDFFNARQFSGKSRSLTLFEVAEIGDEEAVGTGSEEDTKETEQGTKVRTREEEKAVREYFDEFGLLPEEKSVPGQETMETVSVPEVASFIKKPLPSPSLAPTSEIIEMESPKPLPSTPETLKPKPQPGSPTSTPEKEPEIAEGSLTSEDEDPATEPIDHSPRLDVPVPHPAMEEKVDARVSPVPEEQPEIEDIDPSAVAEDPSGTEEHSSSPSTASVKSLEVVEVPAPTTTEGPLDTVESVSRMKTQTTSDVKEAPHSTISESISGFDETPVVKLEEKTVTEATPSTAPEKSLDIEENVPASEPDIELEDSSAESPVLPEAEELIMTIEPKESPATDAVDSISSEESLDIKEISPVIEPKESPATDAVASISSEESLDIKEISPVIEPKESPATDAVASISSEESLDIKEISPVIERESPIPVAVPSITPEEAPDMEELVSSLASEPSPSEHGQEPLEEKAVQRSPAPAPLTIGIEEARVKPYGFDVGSRRPPDTLKLSRSFGLGRPMLPGSHETVHSQHRHPVPPKPTGCGCQSESVVKCEATVMTEHEAAPETVRLSTPMHYQLYYSPIGECSQVCAQAGESYQERSITCRNSAGIPVPITECRHPQDLRTKFYTRCNTHVCGPRHYIVLFEWSTCPQKCATVLENGTIVPNQRVRDYECRKVENGSVVPREECDLFVQDLHLVLKSDCHSIPCERYNYKTSNWSDCDCHSWKRRREVTCLRWSTGEEVDVAVCKAHKLVPPNTEQYCYPAACFGQRQTRRLLQTENDHCHFTQCSNEGDCSGGRCQCKDGFEGVDCQMDKRTSTECPLPSLLDTNGDCCASGVFDLNGQCCQEYEGAAEIDIDGHCCTGSLDACGRCHDKPHYLDATIQCCEVLDASGTCCASGVIDECGVCDGLGGSCDTTISMTIIPHERTNVDNCATELRAVVEDALDTEVFPSCVSSKTRLVVQYIAMNVRKEGIPHVAFSKTHVSMTTGFIYFKLENAMARSQLNLACQVDAINIEKIPVCGNDFCEIGEPERCPQDCGYQIKTCPVKWAEGKLNMCHGHGQCIFVNSSRCECHTGYDGLDCKDCSPGFFHVGNDSRCIPTQAMINRPTIVAYGDASIDTEHPTKRVALHRDVSSNGWRYWPLYVYFILLLVCLIIFLIQRRKQQKEENETWTSFKDKAPSISYRGSV